MQVLADTEGLLKRLFDWATNSKEPLQSYATGNFFVWIDISLNLGKVSNSLTLFKAALAQAPSLLRNSNVCSPFVCINL